MAGPLVNVAIAVSLAVLITILTLLWPINLLMGGLILLLKQLLWINVALVVFNLLPAFPMDGGRVLRAVLALIMPYVEATRIAAGVGKVMAILLAVVGLMVSPTLILVAAFVYLAGGAEARMVERYDRAVRSWPPRAPHPSGHGAGMFIVPGPRPTGFVLNVDSR